MRRLGIVIVGMSLFLAGAGAQSLLVSGTQNIHRKTPQVQGQKAQAAYLRRLQQAQRKALLAQSRALKAQQARARKAAAPHPTHRTAPSRPPTVIVQQVIVQAPTRSTSTAIPTALPPGIVTAVDLGAQTVTVKRENVETTYKVLVNTPIRIDTVGGKTLQDLAKDMTLDVTSIDGKTADTLVAHTPAKPPQ